MDISNFNPTHFHPTHKAKTWMLITIIVVAVGAGGVYYFAKKTYDSKQSQTKPTTSQQETTQVATKPAEQAKQVSEELKAVDLAEIKAAIKDIKDIVAAF
ncbi:TPA: hypothetical protein DIS56_01120 [Candidatus Saccharibacteria bacterium]|nr:MAG: hypothetical protein A3F05_02480 [Candidatus Saccharibacteria bacterium RIFCSPHIGHO2_12_FULL_47_17]HCM51720.1 hypothetical protein [Candidatus Saccharibacteria bacterium]